ncbi:hypothetical protein BGW41_002326 [Actinomortierella wolfii]|nr:hypothetical protein BGW41_002326 [Actinomortierella wolfii]
MLGSDSGSSDLSEVDASSSSSSEEDLTLDHRIPNNRNTNHHQQQPTQTRINIPPNLTPPKKRLPQSSGASYRHNATSSSFSSPITSSSTAPTTVSGKNTSKKYTQAVNMHSSASRSLLSSGSDSDSLGSELSDSDDEELSTAVGGGQKGRGKHLAAKSQPSGPTTSRGAPISLSDSQPVYSQEIMDGTLMLPPHARFNRKVGQSKSSKGDSSSSSRGGKKGGRGGRGLLTGNAKAKGSAETVVIDFEEDGEGLDSDDESQYASLGTNSKPTIPSILATPSSTTKSGKKTKAASKSKEKKSKTKKGGRPSSNKADQEVYCICRGTYDGSEFMIACDRCEEWFHGRCIGMKPQAAKKATHFYCQDCLAAMAQPPPHTPSSEPEGKPKNKKSKSKDKNKEKDKTKKSKKKKSKKVEVDPWAIPEPKPLPEPTKQEYTFEDVEAIDSESSEDEAAYPANHQITPTPHRSYVDEQHQPRPYQHSRAYEQPSSEWHTQQHQQHPYPISSMKYPAAKVPKVASQPSYEPPSQASYYTPSLGASKTYVAPALQPMDDEDEDVCPVCEFECTCGPQIPVQIPPRAPPTPSSVYAAKAPMPPPQARPLYQPRHESVSVGLSFQESPADSFQSAYKSPMVTPSSDSHRRPSISRMGGKGVGKAPAVMKAVKSQAYRSSHGKSLKSSKAMQYYRNLLSSSGSDDDKSDMSSEDEVTGREGKYISHKKNYVVQRDVHSSEDSNEEIVDEEEEDEQLVSEDEVDEVLSIGSSSSLSEPEEEINEYDSANENQYKPRASAINSTKGSKWIAKDVEADQIASPKLQPSTVNATSPPPHISKRGSGRSKKRRDSLGLTREDEDHLYMPAVASSRNRKNNQMSKAHGRSPSKKTHQARRESFSEPSASKPAPTEKNDRPSSPRGFIESDNDKGVGSLSSDDDIFGDGELSDAPSDDYFDGDLSDDIEAFDDLDDDESSQLFEESDDLESTSSGPREYHYSDLEEEDEESLVDSDSSLNSSSHSESDNGSETSTDSEIEPPQPIESPEEEEMLADGNDELDEEELLRLAEEERRILQRAHLLQEYLSEEEEEADPDRNPFESSEEEDSSVDEYEFDADGESYEDDWYEDEDQYFDDGLGDLNLVYDEYKGSKLELQALMMIPPEQQEQLLLLQHYAEQQQLKLQQQQQRQQQEQDPSVTASEAPQSQLPPISEPQDQSFLMTAPDLDAVSEQLAQSLATSMASSLAGSISEASPSGDVSSLTTPLPSSVSPTATPNVDNLLHATHAVTMADEGVSSSITTPVSLPSLVAVSASEPATLTSVTPTPTIMPTPANTPTPPSGGEIASKANDDLPTALGTATGEESAADISSSSSASSMQSKKTTDDLSATTPTSTFSSQELLESLDAHTAQLLAKTFEHSSQELLHDRAASEVPQDIAANLLNTLVFHKRKSEHLEGKDTEKEPKRRRASISATGVGSGLLPDLAAFMDTPAGQFADITSAPKTVAADETHLTLTNLLTSTSASELTPGLISLVTATKIDQQNLNGRRGSVRASKSRRFSKLEHQQDTSATTEEPIPMDDLLDTSALYGEHADDEEQSSSAPQAVSKDLSRWEKVPIGTFRRSRRPSSPYIGLQGAIKSGRKDIESALLSAAAAAQPQQHQEALLRGLAGATTNTARGALRRGARGVSMRRYRSNPASLSGSDFYAVMEPSGTAFESAGMSGRTKLRPIHHLRSASQVPPVTRSPGSSPSFQEAVMALMGNTPPSIHAGMLMEELTSLGSPKDLSSAAVPSLGGGGSSNGRSDPSSSHRWRSMMESGTARISPSGKPSTVALPRSARVTDHAQDSRYHSLSTGVSSRRRQMTRSHSQHALGAYRPLHSRSSTSHPRERRSHDGIVSGLGIDMPAESNGSAMHSSHDNRMEHDGLSRAEDVMTDLSQLPSSACPTPLHSPLFSATSATVSHKDATIPPLTLDQSDFTKLESLTTDTGAGTASIPSAVRAALRRVAEEDEEIDIDDETDVDAIWQATFEHTDKSAGKAQQRVSVSTLSNMDLPSYPQHHHHDFHILIAGAGIGGLMLGIMLDRAGISYHILEKNTADKNVLGSCIMLTPKILKVFDQLGLLEELQSISKEYKQSFVLDEELNSIGKLDLTYAHDRYHYPILVIGRPALMEFLLSKVHPDKVSFGKRILKFEYTTDAKYQASLSEVVSHDSGHDSTATTSEKESYTEHKNHERVIVHCSDSTVYRGDLLVGADGAYSAVRQNMYRRIKEDKSIPLPESDLEPMHFDRHSCLGITDPLDLDKYPLLKSPTCEFRIVVGQTHPFVLWTMPLPNNRLGWSIGGKLFSPLTVHHESSFSCSEYAPESTRELLEKIRDIKTPFGGTVGTDLVDQTPKERVSRILVEEKLFKTWTDERRCVLIGDAAHKPSPSGGHGAMAAIADGVSLCNHLYALLRKLGKGAQSSEGKDGSIASVHGSQPTSQQLREVLRAYYDERYTSARNVILGSSQGNQLLSDQGIIGDIKRKVLLNYLPQWLRFIASDKLMYPQPVLDFLPVPDSQTPVAVGEKTA